MKLIVTGGAGFIGSEFVRQAVRKNHAVVVVDKLSYAGDLARLNEVQDSITFYKADITTKMP
jgi:dTDP-glucose 4,6-dehydratase